MEQGHNIQPIFDLIEEILFLLSRGPVQRQLIVITLALLLASLLSRGVSYLFHSRWAQNRESRAPKTRAIAQFLIRYLTFPLLSLALLYIADWLVSQVWHDAGLLAGFIFLLWQFLTYRFLLALLYAIFGQRIMHRYHYRLLGPLFTLIIILQVLSQLIDLNTLSQVVLLRLFESPITVYALFIATVGFYFWLDATLGIQDLLQKLLTTRSNLDPGSVSASLTLFRYLMIAIGLIFVVSTLGLDSTTVAAITGGLSAGLAFGSRDILNNFISGILLLFDGSLHPNDVVNISGEIGVVKKLSIRSTTLRTLNNVEMIIPNQTFLTSPVTTYNKSDNLVRILIPVGASYESDPETVRDALLAVAQQHPDVQEKPKPVVFFQEFGSSSIDFKLGVWLDDPLMISRVRSELHFMIFKAFAQQHIEMPYPQRELHIRSGVPWEQMVSK